MWFLITNLLAQTNAVYIAKDFENREVIDFVANESVTTYTSTILILFWSYVCCLCRIPLQTQLYYLYSQQFLFGRSESAHLWMIGWTKIINEIHFTVPSIYDEYGNALTISNNHCEEFF